MNRRKLISGLASLGGAFGAARRGYAPKMGVQAYVWQQSLGRDKRTIADGVADVVSSLAEAGYKAVEMTSSFFTPELAPRTLDLLAARGLKLAIVYNGGDMHTADGAARTTDDTLALVERVRAARIEGVSFNPNPKKGRERKTDAELETQTRATGELGKRLHRMKLPLLVHEHAPELAENAREWRHLLRGTDPKHVGVCLDVHWVLRAGLDPMTLVEEAGPRIGDVHLRNSRNGVWLEELADGDVDYSKVAAHLKKIGYRGWLVVELAWDPGTAITRGLTENLRRSRKWAERVFDVRG